MSNKYYHGTDSDSANLMTGPPPNIKVNLGGGELGMGFYTGNFMHIAASWAWERCKTNHLKPCIIEIEIDNIEIAKLSVKHIKTREDVIRLYDMLNATNMEKTHLLNSDYTIAPFISIDSAVQFKFESTNAELTINKSKISIIPCV